tara:strand:+ start:3242 stop:4636 length:1395 start_codon:yes stop_codon:yes gene_type:complete
MSDDTYDILSVALFTDTSGTWVQTGSSVSGNVTSANFTVSSLSNGSYSWNCLVTNTNNDMTSASSNFTFTILASGFSGTISNQTLTEDSNSSNAFDLDTYFTGATTYAVSGNSSIAVFWDSENQVSFMPSANFTGSEIMTFSSDTSATSNSINVSVPNVNDPPYRTGNISNYSIDANTTLTLDLSDIFAEVDPIENLTYSLNALEFSFEQDGDTVTLTPEDNFEGSEEVYITAKDDDSKSVDSNTFTITVGSAESSSDNTAPSIDSYGPEEDPEVEAGESIEFTIESSDAESDDITITWYVDDEAQDVSDSSFTFTPEEDGTYIIKVELFDGTETTTQTWTVIVGIEEEEVVESILAEQTDSPECGNGIEEEGETCSSCALDIICEDGFVCKSGICEEKTNATRALLIFFLIFIVILGTGILIYYFTTLKKSGRGSAKESKGRGLRAAKNRPPSDFTDFYQRRK